MRFVVGVSMIDAQYYVPLARAAEDAGFDGVSVPDSIGYLRESDSTYPYNLDHSRGFLENKPFVEPLVAIAAMSAATSRVRFITAVLKLPIRHPVVFAKEVSSLAVISGGRLSLGVGTSPWPDDYRLVQLPRAKRGSRLEECIEVVRSLCAGGYVEHHGDFYDFPAVKLNPTPAEAVPILVGGHGPANIDRAARIGDGWISAGSTDEDLAERINRLQELRRRYGRDHLPFEIHATTMSSFTLDGVRRLEDMGVTHTSGGIGRFDPYGAEQDPESLQEKIDNVQRYADQVISRLD